jgi:hypothetical protein
LVSDCDGAKCWKQRIQSLELKRTITVIGSDLRLNLSLGLRSGGACIAVATRE